MMRAAALVLSGQAGAAVLTLARNLLLALLLPVEDYGIAATFVLLMAGVEMASALGLQQQIVQAADGDAPRVQAGLQAFQVMRAGVASGAMLLLAGPLAAFLGVPQVAWAYRVLAVMPLLAALVHFDIHRLQRHGQFRPAALTAVLPAAAGLAAVGPLVALFGDWRAMLVSILVQGVCAVVVSHGLAQRRWQVAADSAVMRRGLRFGLPIMGDAVLLFAVFHGEKLVVGHVLGMAMLAVLAMGSTLTLTPALVAARAAQSLFLPRLTSGQGALAVCEAAMAGAALLATGAAVLGPPVVWGLLGEKYQSLAGLIGMLGVQQALRLLREGPAALALAQGRTGVALLANLPRVALLPLALVVAQRTGDLGAVIALAIAGEAAGTALAYALAARWLRLDLTPLRGPLGMTLLCLGLALLAAWPWAAAAAVAACAAVLWRCGALREALRQPLLREAAP